jgi:alpha-glucoside transport system substrate-binding protein
VLFRRDLFDERGYEVPATFEELVALSDRIVADGSAPWCFAGRWSDGPGGFPVTDWIEAFVLSGAGPDVYEAWARGDVGFTSEPVRQAFDRLGHLVFPDGYVVAGAGQIPSIDFYLPAFTMTGAEPNCLMTLATSIVLELVPRDALGLLDVFVLPTETPDGVERLVLGGNHWSTTADTPENRAVMGALLSREHAQVATGVLSSFVSPDIGFRHTKAGNAYETPEPSELQLRLIGLVREAVREGRIVWDASDRMPLDFSRDAFQLAPTGWFETGPATLDELLSDLDAARGLAAR